LSANVDIGTLSMNVNTIRMSMNTDTLIGLRQERVVVEYDVAGWQRFGTAIRDARRAADLTQRELSERAGVSRAWLARVEAGHRRAELEQVFSVLSALGLTMSLRPARRSRGEQAVRDALAKVGRMA